MANAAAFVDESLWRRDKEFRSLPRSAQCTFVQLLSQKDLDCAGILTLHVDYLAKACDEITPEDVWSDLKALEAAEFVFVDTETDELLIRSYVRRVSVRSPNAMKAALRLAKKVSSPKLRSVLAAEMRRVRRAEVTAVADEIDPSPPHPEPIRTPSETGMASEPHAEPPRPEPVPEPVLRSVVGYVGEAPPIFCDKHPNGTDINCRPCGVRREAYEHWVKQWEEMKTQQRAQFWEEVRNCNECDPTGKVSAVGGLKRCPLHDWGMVL